MMSKANTRPGVHALTAREAELVAADPATLSVKDRTRRNAALAKKWKIEAAAAFDRGIRPADTKPRHNTLDTARHARKPELWK